MNTRTIGVWLIIQGDRLNPEVVSKILKINPCKQHVKGLPKQKFPNVIAKTGLWCFESKSDSLDLEDNIFDIIDRLNGFTGMISCIEGVDNAFIDVFLADRDENDERIGTSVFVSCLLMKKISDFGLGLKLSN